MEFEDTVLQLSESNEQKLLSKLDDVEQKLNQDPNSLQFILLKCFLLIALDQEEDAVKIFLDSGYDYRLKEIDEISISWDQMIENNQLQEAYDTLNDTLIKYPLSISILSRMRSVVEKMENKDLIDRCKIKIEAAFYAWNLLFISIANFFLSLKEYDNAINTLNNLLVLFPVSAAAYHLRGICYLNIDKYEEAYQDLQKAVEYKPENIQFNFSLAQCQFKFEKFEDSIQTYQKIIDLDKNKVGAYIKMAQALVRLKKIDESVKVLNDVLKIDPHLDSAYYNLALILIDNERYLEAGQILVKATLLIPQNVSFYELLSRLYKKQGMEQLADKYLDMGADNLLENLLLGLIH
ncbi:tetratricopeptide repeat protein (macronuclear) [Tetrahymena thermophila SB210]|uniref:Tetratricopeptide repeat protein n=1 Tax=Tetrahymena thermophila (strain SB210) TaxID=312017 RepID=Q22RA7_TETTS|nr:tetratricopeptide repeat protein [Tetrahymena thermophila SB210]EAR88215.1 tetratricopeptide repeat protein [Tetrahymena thermophila SB210]|eukprot:XP_001008460.1 tetratricopeptide repeat protein [Tetrahymena thermophila SB210]